MITSLLRLSDTDCAQQRATLQQVHYADPCGDSYNGYTSLQDMKARGKYGHIINISSMSGHRVPNGASGGSFYAATKHALRAMTEGLRQEVRTGWPADLGC